jgi:hypothetical protein
MVALGNQIKDEYHEKPVAKISLWRGYISYGSLSPDILFAFYYCFYFQRREKHMHRNLVLEKH